MRRWILILALPIAAGLFLLLSDRAEFIPDDLTGIWITDDARYEDRYLKLDTSTIIFGQGGVEIEVYFVSDVEVEELPGEIIYVVRCHRTGEDDTTVSLILDAPTRETLCFLNRRGVTWMRSDES